MRQQALSSAQDSEAIGGFISGIGFCLYMTLLFFLASSPATPLLSPVGLDGAYICRAASTVVCSITLILAYFNADAVLRGARTLITYGSVLILPGLLVSAASIFGTVLPYWAFLASWAVLGMGFACLTLMQISLFGTVSGRFAPFSIVLGALAATALFVLIGLQSSARLFIVWAFIIMVACIAVPSFCLQRVDPSAADYVDTTRKIPLSAFPNELFMIVQGIAFGFAMTVMCTLPMSNAIAALSIGSIGDLLALFWALRQRRYEVSQGVVQRASLVPMMAGVLLLPFGGTLWKTCCIIAIMIAVSHSQMMFWIFSIHDIREYQLHPIRRFSYRQVADWAGFVIGTVFGIGVHRLCGFEQSGGGFMLAVVVLAIAIASAFALYGADDALSRQYLRDITEQDETREGGIPVEERFDARCDSLAEQYGLTAREREVFGYLARGRNSRHIQEALFIGPSTVKSHIYNIYKKLGVSSRQEIIDLVEKFED